LALLKKIMDPKNGKTFDWAFATNQDDIDLDYIIPTYKGRWRIETGFRVQDEARIKSKSKDMKIRFFYFVYEQMLQLLCDMSNERVAREERKSARATT
jgi:hypothetical protein